MNEERYISRQIAKYATNKKLIEFIDKMRVPTVDYYAHIQASGEKDKTGKPQNSLIGLKLLDYSEGTGDKTVSVEANVSPHEFGYIFTKLKCGVQEFEWSQDKIFGNPDKDGMSDVTKIKIIRASKDRNGKARNYPWFIQIENGKGIKETREDNGGCYIKANSYIGEAKAYVNINDIDMFCLLSRVSSFVNVWELTFAPKIMREAKEVILRNTKDGAK